MSITLRTFASHLSMYSIDGIPCKRISVFPDSDKEGRAVFVEEFSRIGKGPLRPTGKTLLARIEPGANEGDFVYTQARQYAQKLAGDSNTAFTDLSDRASLSCARYGHE